MEIKKTKKADLENKRGLFLEIGLVLSLALVFLAFEWRIDSYEADVLVDVQELFVDDDVVPITREQIKPPPPPAPILADVLLIVDNEEDFDEILDIIDSEAQIDDAVKIQDVSDDIEDNDEPRVFVIVEDMPEFPGGEIALLKWIAKSVKYPTLALENGIAGRVHLNFVINEKGGIDNIVVTRGVDPSLDKEAVRVIKKMPKWKPGKQRGKAVKVSFSLPINFQLQ
jgi:protein TonB